MDIKNLFKCFCILSLLLKVDGQFTTAITNVSTSITEQPSTSVQPSKTVQPSTTVPTSTTSNKTHSTPSFPVPALNCSAKANCKECTSDNHCFWCAPSNLCHKYEGILPSGCKKNNWFWKQCTVPGYILIFVAPALAGLLLLTCCCCIYCKCCRSKSLHWKKVEEKLAERRKDRQQKADEKKSERKKRTDAMRMKYGLLKDDDDDEAPLV